MTVTWTSGYSIKEAIPFVEWGHKGGNQMLSPAGTLTFSRNSMCGVFYQQSFLLENDHFALMEMAFFIFFVQPLSAGSPARTVGWRDPGYIHTSFLKELWPDSLYVICITSFNQHSLFFLFLY